MLSLYLRIEPGDAKVPVELPVDGTVGDLRAAVFQAGGPEPSKQVLLVGTEELKHSRGTLLSDTHLLSNEALVAVRWQENSTVAFNCGFRHGLALLQGGEVVGWGDKRSFEPIPEFGGPVDGVFAGVCVSFALVGGRLVAWGSDARNYEEDLQRIDKTVTGCSAAVGANLALVLDADYCLHLCGPDKVYFKAAMERAAQHRLLANVFQASCWSRSHFVVLYRNRTAVSFGADGELRVLCKWRAVGVRAGGGHVVVLMQDGRVRCYGDNRFGQCDVPRLPANVDWCTAGDRHTAACCEDGSVVWWGDRLPTDRITEAGACVAIEFGDYFVAAVTDDGRVVCDGHRSVRQHGVLDPDIDGCGAARSPQ
eukprot:TRINITY_DN9041_c0_g2_i1.p1 TRINITY_DN9041_c0_g2~~TRINITY_DN9041_c0_g2_i1.p1  ORF type:complete len:366 (+),score=122.78 TRINITY_DN9041_c0_g2_i1:51-1148(+)